MLRLYKPYKLSKIEWLHVSTVLLPYVQQHGGKKAWEKGDNATKDLKNHICEFTLLNQRNQCVYCEDLITGGAQLDHIVPKQLHPVFCFEPKNLVSSCAVCNLYIKNGGDTIKLPEKKRYNQNLFTIVHPYFNDPDVHIKFINDDRVVIDTKRCTDLGRATIDFFHLNDYPAYCKRANRYHDYQQYPIDAVKLAKACSAYKR